jgi:ethanolaminephosphotransferase
MLFGGLGTIGNIVNRYVHPASKVNKCSWYSYWNVLITRKKDGKPLLTPLLGYLPFLLHSLILVSWLQSELRGGVQLVHDARLLPFLGYWAMAYVPVHLSVSDVSLTTSFAYQVSQLILAHVTKSPFPYWNGMMVYSLFGAIDANAQYLFNR